MTDVCESLRLLQECENVGVRAADSIKHTNSDGLMISAQGDLCCTAAAAVVPFVRHTRRIIVEQRAMYMCWNTHTIWLMQL